jgi:cytochrome d ubiquinol oxidase subunit I
VGARYLVQNRFIEEAKTMVRMGLGMVAVLAPLQLVIGDLHGLNTKEHQPAKLATIEGHWNSNEPADFVLFAMPNKEGSGNDYEVKLPIPGLASYVITHDFKGTFPGLNDFKPEDRPPFLPVFLSFRVMVGLGLLMILMGLTGAFFWLRGTLFEKRWYFALVQHSWPMGFIAILAGWWVTESGRQPWLATGIIRTYDAVSPAITFNAVLTTLILFVLVYSAVFTMGTYYINRLINKGPAGAAEKPPHGQPTRPLSAAEDATREAIIGA